MCPASARGARHGGRHVAALLASGVGIALPLIALAWVNAAQTGDPLRFGYIEMWGRSHELGFHEAPWGFPHTPARGLELVNLYLLRLQSYFLETPVPSLLFATGALALVRRVQAVDRWALIACGGVLLAYWAYWHDGFYLGPRFMLPLAPWLALWTARFPAELAARTPSVPLHRAVLVAGLAALVIGSTQLGCGGSASRVSRPNSSIAASTSADSTKRWLRWNSGEAAPRRWRLPSPETVPTLPS